MVQWQGTQGGETTTEGTSADCWQRFWRDQRTSSKNIRFGDFVSLLEALGFRLARVSGSHQIFQHTAVREPVNIQEVRGQVKPYQIRQVVELIEIYGLTLEADEED